MGKSSKTFQYQATMSINRAEFTRKVVLNENLTKKDLRVLMHLMTEIDTRDYRSISKKSIATTLNLSKKEVTEAIYNLCIQNIIEEGDSDTVRGGYKTLF